MTDEKKPPEQRVYEYDERVNPVEVVPGDTMLIDAIDAHIEANVGPVESVFHELVSDLVHLDIHMVAPTENRPFYTLVTSGMSARPMNSPVEGCEFAELVVCLPPDWHLTEAAFEDEANYWPVRQLKMIARMPHMYDSWVWRSHTVPYGDPPTPYAANTEQCCVIVSAPVSLPESFDVLELDDRSIHFFALVPLHESEMTYKLEHGAEALFEKLEAAGVGDVIEPGRPAVV